MKRLGLPVIACVFLASCSGVPAGSKGTKWRPYVVECLDTLVEHGTDTYGGLETPLIMAVIDVRTLKSPEKPEIYDSLVRLEEDRIHRRGERGSNLWYDQKLIASMYRVSKLTGDPKYRAAADAYVDYALRSCWYKQGLMAWGTHVYWNAYEEKPDGDHEGRGPHEILTYHPEWAEMYRINPKRVVREAEQVWEYHVWDKRTGAHNRHDDGHPGCDFAFSGGSFAVLFSFLYKATGEVRWLDQARKIVNWHWRHRDPKTGLVPSTPTLKDRYDGRHCFTDVPGPFCAFALRCSELTGEKWFQDVAVALIKAYDKYGWDEKLKTYHAMLKLDGTPVPARAKLSGYDVFAPTGLIQVWPTILYPYEHPLVFAQTAVWAYEKTGDKELLQIALKLADLIERNLPPYTGRRWKKELEAAMPGVKETGGTYAENYARVISFYVDLARAAKEEKYLRLAEKVAEEAVAKLFENGIFKGHPAKPYYENTNGVPLLLFALLELDAPDEDLGGAF